MKNSKQNQPPQGLDLEKLRLEFQETLQMGREVDKMLAKARQAERTAKRQKDKDTAKP